MLLYGNERVTRIDRGVLRLARLVSRSSESCSHLAPKYIPSPYTNSEPPHKQIPSPHTFRAPIQIPVPYQICVRDADLPFSLAYVRLLRPADSDSIGRMRLHRLCRASSETREKLLTKHVVDGAEVPTACGRPTLRAQLASIAIHSRATTDY